MALAKSIAPWGGHVHILLLDRKNPIDITNAKNSSIYELENLSNSIVPALKNKYKANSDEFRWSLKPVFLEFLLDNYESVIYVDNDIFFFDDYCFLFDELKQFDILLSPHNYPADPEKNQNWLEANFRVGLYNAGFVGANQNAKKTLAWWAKCCLYRCEKNYFRGLFDDQKYLDLVPIIHPNTKVIAHKGCNVAEWNAQICVKSEKDKQVVINEVFPLIFYHFNAFSLRLLDKNSIIFKKYFLALKKFKKDLLEEDLAYSQPWMEKVKLKIWEFLNAIHK
jgi:hypothetical protein